MAATSENGTVVEGQDDATMPMKEAEATNNIENVDSIAPSTTTTTTKDYDTKSYSDLPLHIQCDPFLVGLTAVATTNNGVTSTGTKGISELLQEPPKSTTAKDQNKAKVSNATPCSTTSTPSTYLEVEPLMSQLVPKVVADAINLELSKSFSDLQLVSAEGGGDDNKNTDNSEEQTGPEAPDWQTLPKNLLGKVAFFEKMMHQKQQKTPKADPTIKVKAEVSEKVKSAHHQVQTSLMATKASPSSAAANGSSNGGSVLPEGVTPLAVKKERVQTFFPKDETTAAATKSVTSSSDTSATAPKWDKVETSVPSTFDNSTATVAEESEPKSETTPEAFPGSPAPTVDDMVSAMEKSLDNELKSLKSEFSNFDDKADNFSRKIDAKNELSVNGGSFDAVTREEDVPSTEASIEQAKVDATPSEVPRNGENGAVEKTASAEVVEEEESVAVVVKETATAVVKETATAVANKEEPTAEAEKKTADLPPTAPTEQAKPDATPTEVPSNGEHSAEKKVSPTMVDEEKITPVEEEIVVAVEEKVEPTVKLIEVADSNGQSAPEKELTVDPEVISGDLAATEALKAVAKEQEVSEKEVAVDPAVLSGDRAATEALKVVAEGEDVSEAVEESIDPKVATGDLAATESLKTIEKGDDASKAVEETIGPMVAAGALAATEALKTAEREDHASKAVEETIDPMVAAGDLAATEALKTVEAQPNAAVLSSDLLDGLEGEVTPEEIHGESLSRDVAAEVLQADDEPASEDESPSVVASLPAKDFPSLANNTLVSSKRSSSRNAPTTKSYATILAEGKKQELAKAFDILAQYRPVPSVVEEQKTKTAAVKAPKDTPSAEDKSTPESDGKQTLANQLSEGSEQKKNKTFVEESKEEPSADPGFTAIYRGKRSDEDATEETSPPITLELPKEVGSLAAANFNPYDVLVDDVQVDDEMVDQADEVSTKLTPKKGKAKKGKGAKTQNTEPKPASLNKKVKFSGNTKGKKAKKFKAVTGTDSKASTPLVAMPVHLLNNLVHMRPISYIVDGLLWGAVLLVGGPLAAVGLVLLSVFRLIKWLAQLFGFGIIAPKKTPGQQLAVVITGCDSGFGRDLALELMREGFVVFCGCLMKESLKSFKDEKLAVPIQMDVTKDADVDKVAKAVKDWLAKDEDRHLHALVNNAGIGTSGLIDWVPVSAFQKMIDVNYLGMVRCCKTFLPIFKSQASQGIYSDHRIVNMVSMAGLVSGGMVSVGYEASKHAAEAFTTNLRLETKGLGLKVTAVSPSFHRTPMTNTMGEDVRKMWKTLSPEKKKDYGKDYVDDACGFADLATNVINWDSRNVVHAMQKSLTDKYPPPRIMVGSDARYMLILTKMLPTWYSSRLLAQNTPEVAMMQKKK